MWLQAGVFILLVGLSGLLWAEWQSHVRLRWLAKPCASFGFLLIAGDAFPLVGHAHVLIFTGLVLGAGGDLFLLGANRRSFLLGLLLFLLGHIAYALCFLHVLTSFEALWLPALVTLCLLGGVGRQAWPYLGRMKVAVAAYMVVIGAMLVLAYGDGIPTIWTLAATLFAGSDLFVLRQRFIHQTRVNRFWGLPLYYAAQALLAASLRILGV